MVSQLSGTLMAAARSSINQLKQPDNHLISDIRKQQQIHLSGQMKFVKSRVREIKHFI